MRAVLLAVLCTVGACGGAHRESALRHATETLERSAELTPDPRVQTALALAYERGGRLDDAERLASRVHGAPLPPTWRARLATLEARLVAERGGAPRVEDRQLEDDVVRWATQLADEAERLRQGTVHEGD